MTRAVECGLGYETRRTPATQASCYRLPNWLHVLPALGIQNTLHLAVALTKSPRRPCAELEVDPFALHLVVAQMKASLFLTPDPHNSVT